jgi:hypothetical protein
MPQRVNQTAIRARAGADRQISNADVDAIAVMVVRRLSQVAPAALIQGMESELLELADRSTGLGLGRPIRPRRR